ncbi:hypothetical protein [Algisphaera agarilytica]|uniref:Glycoside hydrolase family 2 immunoglobulin-like beta-sandwich domain-containing protein n=1 Tax=Algisphaera agarilytica TaxID=1385975 RepID=A0A7X0H8I4_9BACT|nr:hypothetical protein [Algisphaera agarilytica]MBB6431083.1 hypothetical protein [Algisphaera agarilytica]
MHHGVRLESIRPLVRYVDRDQAVIDAHFTTLPAVTGSISQPPGGAVDVQIEIDGSDGFHDEGSARVQLTDHSGSVRFEIVRPQRWWPAGMGEQALYTLSVTVQEPGLGYAEQSVTFGLTSVRRDRVLGEEFDESLLVNGRICDFDSVVVIDRTDANQLLPATGESLLLVRDHFGPELLYDAADRAGILLVQCVPIDPEAQVESSVAAQVSRLSSHPSLAGYFVGHLGALSDRVAEALRQIDPTRMVFRRFPLAEVA